MDITVDAYGTMAIKDDNLSIGLVHILNDEIISYKQNEFIEHTQLYPAVKSRRKYELTILDKHHQDLQNAGNFAKLTYTDFSDKKHDLFIKTNPILSFRLKWANKQTIWQQDKYANTKWIIPTILTAISVFYGVIKTNQSTTKTAELEESIKSYTNKSTIDSAQIVALTSDISRIDNLLDSLTKRIDRLDSIDNNSPK